MSIDLKKVAEEMFIKYLESVRLANRIDLFLPRDLENFKVVFRAGFVSGYNYEKQK